MTDTPNNLGLPAGDARRAARSTSAPWWQALMTVASAAVIAFSYANPFNGLTSLLSLAFLMGFVVVHRPKRPPATVRQSSWLSWVVLCATVFVVFFVATVLRNAQTPGTALAFGVQFLSAVILLGVGSAICAYLEARRRRKHRSAGATDDDPHG